MMMMNRINKLVLHTRLVLHKSTESTYKFELRVNGFNSSMTETQRNEQNEVTNLRNSSL
jgi:hypothetical protein